jgi:hypothetical protein
VLAVDVRQLLDTDPVDLPKVNITPYGRTMALARRTPWSRRCILDTQSWAYRRYIHPGMWPRRRPHQ